MKELLEYIAKSLVDCPENVYVTQEDGDNSMVLKLHVAESDMGKVIGKQGRIAKSIRSVMKACASREVIRVIVEIVQ